VSERGSPDGDRGADEWREAADPRCSSSVKYKTLDKNKLIPSIIFHYLSNYIFSWRV